MVDLVVGYVVLARRSSGLVRKATEDWVEGDGDGFWVFGKAVAVEADWF